MRLRIYRPCPLDCRMRSTITWPRPGTRKSCSFEAQLILTGKYSGCSWAQRSLGSVLGAIQQSEAIALFTRWHLALDHIPYTTHPGLSCRRTLETDPLRTKILTHLCIRLPSVGRRHLQRPARRRWTPVLPGYYRRQQSGPEALPGDRGRCSGIDTELARSAVVTQPAGPQSAETGDR